MANKFEELGLNIEIVKGLEKMGIKVPTGIQSSSIPPALENKDIIGQSQTGSGKTLAYLLPLFMKIDPKRREMQAIILAPTHELVIQIERQVKILSENSGVPVTSTPIIGEANMQRQIEKLREKPHIIVGSPGRIFELIKMKKISAHTVKTIVIDEGDKMLDEGSISKVSDILKTTMRDRQLMVFSATISEKALKDAAALMKEPQIIKIEAAVPVTQNITHMYFTSEQREKIDVLRKLIAAIKPERAIVFLNRVEDVEVLTSKLKYHNIRAESIFGATSKEDRKRALENFRTGRLQLLIASDVAARGLDVEGVTHIFNLSLPRDSKDYLHRIGRTGRAGKSGTAISIITRAEISDLRKYEKDFNIKIEPKRVYKGAILDGLGPGNFSAGKPSSRDERVGIRTSRVQGNNKKHIEKERAKSQS